MIRLLLILAFTGTDDLGAECATVPAESMAAMVCDVVQHNPRWFGGDEQEFFPGIVVGDLDTDAHVPDVVIQPGVR